MAEVAISGNDLRYGRPILAANLDIPPDRTDHEDMNAITRDEIDAKLQAIEARMDSRLASIEGKIDGFVGRIEEKFNRMDDRMNHIEADISGSKQDMKSLKNTVLTTGIGSVIAIVLGVAAFNATLLSNMVSSFESGKNTAAAQAEVKQQSEQTAAILKQIQEQLPPRK